LQQGKVLELIQETSKLRQAFVRGKEDLDMKLSKIEKQQQLLNVQFGRFQVQLDRLSKVTLPDMIKTFMENESKVNRKLEENQQAISSLQASLNGSHKEKSESEELGKVMDKMKKLEEAQLENKQKIASLHSGDARVAQHQPATKEDMEDLKQRLDVIKNSCRTQQRGMHFLADNLHVTRKQISVDRQVMAEKIASLSISYAASTRSANMVFDRMNSTDKVIRHIVSKVLPSYESKMQKLNGALCASTTRAPGILVHDRLHGMEEAMVDLKASVQLLLNKSSNAPQESSLLDAHLEDVYSLQPPLVPLASKKFN
jgi:hypothetical protein